MENIIPPSQSEIRIVVIASDPLARAGLAAMLTGLPDCVVVGQLQPGEGLLDALDVYQPQSVVWDLGIDPVDALEMVNDVQEVCPAIVALLPDEVGVAKAWSSGLRTLLQRSVGPESLRAAVIASVQGLVTIDPEFTASLMSVRSLPSDFHPRIELTPRELQVLRHLGEGVSNKTIAYKLDISEHTVKFHVNSIMSKLGAQSRTEAVVQATRIGLVPL